MRKSDTGRIHAYLLVVLGAALLLAVATAPIMAAEAPAIEWQTRLGGSGFD